MTDEEVRVPLFTIGFKLDEWGDLVMDEFYTYDSFTDLSIEMQDKLINEAMRTLGESPVYAGRGKSISLD